MKQEDKEKVVHHALINGYERFYRLAFSYVKNEADAMDIVQESAYKAIQKCDGLKSEEYVMTWLYRIVVNEALQFIRKQKRETTTEAIPEESALDQYADIDLEAAIEKLEPRDQAIIRLRFFEDMTISDIAAILQYSQSTVKSRLYRAMDKMKVQLETERNAI